MVKGFVFGLLFVLVLLAIGGYLFISRGMLPAGQDVTPSPLETWAARTSLRAAVAREAGLLKSPVQPTDENLTAGIALYRAHCQVCHGGPNAVASAAAKGLSPAPPQLARDGVEDDPEGVIYWKIAHGIRFTGMPAFGKSLAQPDIWKVTLSGLARRESRRRRSIARRALELTADGSGPALGSSPSARPAEVPRTLTKRLATGEIAAQTITVSKFVMPTPAKKTVAK